MNKLSISFISILSVLSFTTAWAQNFTLLDNAPNQVIAAHQLESVPFMHSDINGTSYIDFSKNHKITMLEAGAPQLPIFSKSFLLPEKGKATLVVEFDNYYELSDIQVTPSKGNLKRNVNPSLAPYTFGAAYNQDAFFPGKLAVASDPFILRELRGQTITLYPYQYNPVTKKMRVYENLRVRIVTNPTQTGINEITEQSKGKATLGMFNSHFLNGQTIAKYAPKNEEGEMLIITDANFEEALQPLAKWKNQKGIKTTIVNTTVTGTSSENIKAYIQNFYSSNPNLLYLLLVGDNAEIPAYSYGNSGNEELYSDSYYGQLSGNDYYPELFVGRFSGNAANVTTMVERGLEYEKNPAAGNWMTKAIGLGSGEGEGYGDDDEADWEHLRNLRTKLINFGYSQVHEFYDGSRGGEDANGDPTATNILAAINDGVGFMNYTGHGDLNLLVSGNFTSTNVNAAVNNGKYPFVLSVACNNGTYIYGNCISEAWLRARKNNTPSGAIAACGSSILMAWAQPMQTQDEMTALVTESYPQNKKTTLGGLFYNAQISMLEEYPGMDGNEVMQTWIFFGDPSVEFRNKETMNMNVSHVHQVPQTTTSLAVYCDVEGTLISISQNNIFLGKGIISGGAVTIAFPTLISDLPLTVVATKQNYRPYSGNIQVGNGPLGIETTTIDDLSVFPNPVSDELFIHFTAEQDATISLLDITGKVVKQISAEAGTKQSSIHTGNLSAGVYQLLITSGNKKSVSKVFVK